MNRTLMIIALGCVAAVTLLAAPTFAQEPPDMPPEGMPPPDRPAPDDMAPPPGGPPPEAPVNEWLERMRQKHPEEFERMKALHKDDPAAFRDAMREHLQKQRVMAALESHPGVRDAFMALTEEQRAELLRQFGQAGGPPGGRGGRGGPHGMPGPEAANPELRRMNQEVLDLAKRFRAAADSGEKAELKTVLREKIAVMFDQRESERRKHIDRIETDLGKLKSTVERRQASREQIIDRRVWELTEDESLKW